MKQKLLFLILIIAVPFLPATSQKVQKRVISGIVVNEEGKPVRGASIFIDAWETPVKTDKNGEFRLTLKGEAAMIYVVKQDEGIAEAEIGTQAEFRFTLIKANIIKLLTPEHGDEMVDVGYSAIRKKYLTTSVGTIDGDNPKFRSYTNIYEMIKGEVPGVFVHGTSITIRGISSINSSTQPLFVVDGIPVDHVGDIPPSEVASIQILKGADASMYGSRGANGVILIKLRKKR
ncbi:MAG: hypothetical protein FJY11_01285 [Bacteroidetes bacterium]|nr:hypothetical protein [Bacteroidota bacterium]